MPPAPSSPRLAAALLVVFAIGAAGPAGDPPTAFPAKDFAEYWSAARVHLRGGDPYDGAQLLPLQRDILAEPERADAIMLWTPPWTLPLYWPFGALPARSGHLAWVAVQLAALAAATRLLWRAYDGPTGVGPLARVGWWLAPVALVGLFAPTAWMVAYGQNTGFLALGLAGFLYHRTRGRPLTAGAFAALTAIKPHLLAVFGVALILDAVTRPGRRALAGGVAVLLAGAALTLLPDPDVFNQFVHALQRPPSPESIPLSHWQLPTLSFLLRDALAADRFNDNPAALFWVQFVPCVAACLLAVPYRLLRGREWDWTKELPGLVIVSVLVAPYGAWLFDLTVMVVPVVRAAVLLARHGRPVPASLAVAGLSLLLVVTIRLPQYLLGLGLDYQLHNFVWFAPFVALWYVAVAAWCRPAVLPGTGPRS